MSLLDWRVGVLVGGSVGINLNAEAQGGLIGTISNAHKPEDLNGTSVAVGVEANGPLFGGGLSGGNLHPIGFNVGRDQPTTINLTGTVGPSVEPVSGSGMIGPTKGESISVLEIIIAIHSWWNQ